MNDLRSVELLATDLDGTLLDAEGEPVALSTSGIREAIARGVKVIAATARGPKSTLYIANQVGLGPLVVCSNGAVGIDIGTGKKIWARTMEPGWVSAMVKHLSALSKGLRFAVESITGFRAEPEFLKELYSFATLVDREQLTQDEPIVKIVMRHPDLDAKGLADELRPMTPDVELLPGSTDWVEILPKGVNKGFGVGLAADILGIPIENTAVVGDHLNDIPMFLATPNSFAVANAHEVALRTAAEIVPSNIAGGVGYLASRIGPEQIRGQGSRRIQSRMRGQGQL
jgi:Cof subfamily protein (haloacid dehalogenase superfamily)